MLINKSIKNSNKRALYFASRINKQKTHLPSRSLNHLEDSIQTVQERVSTLSKTKNTTNQERVLTPSQQEVFLHDL